MGTKIERFEDILVWQKSLDLSIAIKRAFLGLKDFSYWDQIWRATISIMNNIAEGYERKSNKELQHFLFISKGSCGEVRSLLHLGLKLKYVSVEQHGQLVSYCLEISKMLSGFIKAL